MTTTATAQRPKVTVGETEVTIKNPEEAAEVREVAYEAMTREQLREELDARGITWTSKTLKPELIKLLVDSEEAHERNVLGTVGHAVATPVVLVGHGARGLYRGVTRKYNKAMTIRAGRNALKQSMRDQMYAIGTQVRAGNTPPNPFAQVVTPNAGTKK